jgi:hypothetical protein
LFGGPSAVFAGNHLRRRQLARDSADPRAGALNELAEKIVVHERDRKSSAQTKQQIDIHLSFIGNFELPQPEADPAETAAQEEATKERLHQNYLKRKANGKQAEYERRYEPLRKARFQERKAAAREIVAALAESEGKSPIWRYAAATAQ